MRQAIKTILLMGALALGVQSARGFVPGGPIGNGGDSWQTPVIGYGFAGDLLAPKNIGEEYRRNIPVMYYAYDANFLGYFGLGGTTNVDAAFAIMNGVTNVSSYSSGLTEFSLDTQQINFQAQALALTDLKSVTLGLLVEQMGLADPERYVWTLHDRLPASPCSPLTTEYLVIQRNLDITASPLNQIQYSPYINSVLYSFIIFPNACSGGNPLGDTVPFSVDPFADAFNTVAGFQGNLNLYGGYYTGLTRDDVAGLRYQLSASNINFENAGAGALLSVTNFLPNALLTTLPISLLISQALTTDPVTLQALYASNGGLTILSVKTNFVNLATTNLSAYFTNLPPPYTNNGGPTFTSSEPFPAWSPVQYTLNQLPPLTTLSLGTFLSLVPVTDPATLQGLYPGLAIASVDTNFLSVGTVTNLSAYFTNLPPPYTNNGGPTFTSSEPFPAWSPVQYTLNQLPPLTTLSLGTFLSLVPVTDPATLQGLYPGLAIASVDTNFLSVGTVTNLSAYFTNLPPPYTNNGGPTFTSSEPFPAWSPVQYTLNQLPPLTTLSLGTFLSLVPVTDPATLQGLYPGLAIASVDTNFLSVGTVTNLSAYFTNLPPPYTNNGGPTFTSSEPFPAWSPVQYTLNQLPPLTTLSLGTFLSLVPVTDPATLQGLYPGLAIASVDTNFLSVGTVTNLSAYFTNLPPPYTNVVAQTFPPNPPLTPVPFTNVSGLPFPAWTTVQYASQQLLTTFSLATFLTLIQTTDPATLASLYPNLLISSVNTNYFQVLVTTNTTPVITNGMTIGAVITGALTNHGPFITHTGTYFTNEPAPTVIQYAKNSIIFSNLNLALFVLQARTNDPATLQALYPDLVIVDYSYYYTNVYTPNIFTYLTNSYGAPYSGPPVQKTVTNGFTLTYQPIYSYIFGNVVTNTYYTNTLVTLTSTWVNSVNGAPVGSPPVTNVVTKSYYTNQISGDFFLIPPAWCGFKVTQMLSTNLLPGISNVVVYQGYTNVLNGIPYGLTQVYSYHFTNHTYAIDIGTCEAGLTYATTYGTNIVTEYNYTFFNLVTSSYYTNSPVTIITNSIVATNGGTVGILYTNSTTNMSYAGPPEGDFWIVPANWCGYQQVTLLTNVVLMTNTVVALTPGSGNIGQQYSVTTVSQYTNHTFALRPGVCEAALAFGTNYNTNIVTQYSYTFFNLLTNYYGSTYETVVTTNVAAVANGPVGQLTNLSTVTSGYVNVPSGDFWIVPTNWCGYQLVSLLTNVVLTTNVVVLAPAAGSGNIGQQYSVTTVSQYTNHTFALRPGVCEAALAFGTNYNTNIVTQYSYTFFNLLTNYYGSTYETVVTTNVAAVANGPVGQLTNLSTVTSGYVNVPSGDFWIVPTNWCGYQLVSLLTNVVLTTNVVVLAPAAGSGNIGQQYSVTTVSQYTNHTFALRPGVCEAALAFGTNYNTNIVTQYSYTFFNLLTNYYGSTYETVVTTNVAAVANGPVGQLTNLSTVTSGYVNVPSGDFWIVPTNWCGYQLVSLLTNVVLTTNVVVLAPAAGSGNIGQQYSVTTVSQYTNHTFALRPGVCEAALAFGTNYNTNIVTQYSYTFFNLLTNYYGSTYETVVTTNVAAVANGPVGQLTNLSTVTSGYVNVPSGDFWIVPTNWCGYQLVSLLTNVVLTTNVVVLAPAAGSGNIGQQYSVTTVSQYTNHTFALRPGVCEAALAFGTNYNTNIVTQYQYSFGNVVTNSYFTNSLVTIITTNIEPVTNGTVGQLTNLSYTTNIVVTNLISGDFYIVPPDWCGYSIISNQLTSTIFTTNTITATILPGVPDIGEQYSQTTISSFTNHTFVVQVQLCQFVSPPAALREGIEHVQFIRANFDSLLGQFFQPITNNFTMVKDVGSLAVTEYYRRVITRPDILLSAQDLTLTFATRSNPNFDQGNVLSGLAGPGVINPTTTISYNKVGDIFVNGSLALYFLTTNSFLNGNTQGSPLGSGNNLSVLTWASFDGSTNEPVVYPNGTSIQDLENQLVIQVSPSSLPDGTNGLAYTSTTFTATGGQPPFVWTVTPAALPPGLNLSSSGVLSGTPSGSAGVYDFTLTLTDSVNRVVNLTYSITIH